MRLVLISETNMLAKSEKKRARKLAEEQGLQDLDAFDEEINETLGGPQ